MSLVPPQVTARTATAAHCADTPVCRQTVSGFIIQALGVPATFGIAAIVYCALLPAMYFVVVETTYKRPGDVVLSEEERAAAKKLGEDGESWMEVEMGDPGKEPRESYASQLRLFRGRLSDQAFWKGALKPFPLIAFPAVLFSTLVYASFFCWLLMIGVLSVTIFAAPPYGLNPAQIGLTNLPLAVGALVFTPLSGWMADAVPMWMARRNGGVYEPEFRLALMAIAVPLTTVGFIGFGVAVERGDSLAWCLVWITMHSAAVPFASQAAISYVIDCHTSDANQAFVTINFVKALLSFLASSVSNGLLARHGAQTLFVGIALLNLGISLLTIPSYVYGKRMRSWVRTHPPALLFPLLQTQSSAVFMRECSVLTTEYRWLGVLGRRRSRLRGCSWCFDGGKMHITLGFPAIRRMIWSSHGYTSSLWQSSVQNWLFLRVEHGGPHNHF